MRTALHSKNTVSAQFTILFRAMKKQRLMVYNAFPKSLELLFRELWMQRSHCFEIWAAMEQVQTCDWLSLVRRTQARWFL